MRPTHFSFILFQHEQTWIPELKIAICPMRMRLELDFCLRIADLIINSLPENDAETSAKDNQKTIQGINRKLAYMSEKRYGTDSMVYIEDLSIDTTWFELEINFKPNTEQGNEEDALEDDSMLALSSLGRSTKSTLSAGLITWLRNVASAFPHISPKFVFKALTRHDTYCNAEELSGNIVSYYMTSCILQSYKVSFLCTIGLHFQYIIIFYDVSPSL